MNNLIQYSLTAPEILITTPETLLQKIYKFNNDSLDVLAESKVKVCLYDPDKIEPSSIKVKKSFKYPFINRKIGEQLKNQGYVVCVEPKYHWSEYLLALYVDVFLRSVIRLVYSIFKSIITGKLITQLPLKYRHNVCFGNDVIYWIVYLDLKQLNDLRPEKELKINLTANRIIAELNDLLLYEQSGKIIFGENVNGKFFKILTFRKSSNNQHLILKAILNNSGQVKIKDLTKIISPLRRGLIDYFSKPSIEDTIINVYERLQKELKNNCNYRLIKCGEILKLIKAKTTV